MESELTFFQEFIKIWEFVFVLLWEVFKGIGLRGWGFIGLNLIIILGIAFLFSYILERLKGAK